MFTLQVGSQVGAVWKCVGQQMFLVLTHITPAGDIEEAAVPMDDTGLIPAFHCQRDKEDQAEILGQ